MRLSRLQKFILLECYGNNGIGQKTAFYGFYPAGELKKNRHQIQLVVHRSLESLVEKDLAVAYGRRTREKWFIDKVRLTAHGKRLAKELMLSRQKKLPIK